MEEDCIERHRLWKCGRTKREEIYCMRQLGRCTRFAALEKKFWRTNWPTLRLRFP